MKPSEVSGLLRRIAAAIDNSKSPDRRMIVADLKKVVAQISETAMPASKGGMDMVQKYIDDLKKAFEAKDDGAFAKALEAVEKAAVLPK